MNVQEIDHVNKLLHDGVGSGLAGRKFNGVGNFTVGFTGEVDPVAIAFAISLGVFAVEG